MSQTELSCGVRWTVSAASESGCRRALQTFPSNCTLVVFKGQKL